MASMGARDTRAAVCGWLAIRGARVARLRHPELSEISAYCFYATTLRFGARAFDIGANRGVHSGKCSLNRGARSVATSIAPEFHSCNSQIRDAQAGSLKGLGSWGDAKWGNVYARLTER
jgi:hypothetical protein